MEVVQGLGGSELPGFQWGGNVKRCFALGPKTLSDHGWLCENRTMSQINEPGFSHASFHGWMGLGHKDITPPVGIYARNWGAAKHDVADSIHRSLVLKTLTLATSSDEVPLVFIDADLGWWRTPETYRQFSIRLLEELALPPEKLIFALSHTHSAPPLMEMDEELPGSEILGEWRENLFQAAFQAVQEARENSFEGVLDWGKGTCNLASFRDFPDPDPQRNRVVCGYNPEGKPDDTLLVGRLTDSTGRIRATLTHYACHPTTLAHQNTAISPDYVGAMRDTLQELTGAPALFMLGACGDLAPRYQYVGDLDVADRHGQQLAFATMAALQGMEPAGTRLDYVNTVESGASLAIWQHRARELPRELRVIQTSVSLPLKDWPVAKELERQRQACSDRTLEERLRRKRDIRRGIGDGTGYDLPLYVWSLGEAVLVGCCCEAYSVLQEELRRRFPQLTLVCMNLINGSIGYLPPAECYDQELYPVWQTPFDQGSLERLLEAMTDAIRRIT